MKNLIIIGARGYGREVYNWATQCKEYNKDWIIKGFLDDKSDVLDSMGYPVPIISSVEDYIIEKDDVFICALGEVKYKKKYVELILSKGGEFINIIHPLAQINNFSKVGKGIIICSFCAISNETIIGDFVTIQSFSGIGHDAKIGNWCHLNAYSFMGGYAELKEEVTLHTKASILPKVKVGKGAVVGAHSLVIKNVKEGVTVFGSPAKEIF
ncbi:NeuD/PglB/VioB family sugar acetyltransferase [Pedobacter alpinus]|uniref:NeuD/PglB/VioB family sugar acetyltransferase n=1 Tax=Pedobacter alpinus TaxID=1590643 RepID=A0ABW5TRB5_9SPHI